MRPNRRPFRPSPLVVGSGALHAGALAAVLRWPTSWPSVALAVLANHVVLALAGLWPRGSLLGPNLRRLRQNGESSSRTVALTFDDGPEPDVTPRVLELLARAGARATFFLIGERAAREPVLVREIADAGHAIANHTWSHSKAFALLPPRAMSAEIDRAQDLLATSTGAPPLFFRPPAGFQNVLLEPLLARRGLHLASWTRRGLDAFAQNADAVYRRLSPLSAGDILLLHDGQLTGTQRKLSAEGRPLVISVLPRLLEDLERERLSSVALGPEQLSPAKLGLAGV